MMIITKLSKLALLEMLTRGLKKKLITVELIGVRASYLFKDIVKVCKNLQTGFQKKKKKVKEKTNSKVTSFDILYILKSQNKPRFF